MSMRVVLVDVLISDNVDFRRVNVAVFFVVDIVVVDVIVDCISHCVSALLFLCCRLS